MSTLNITVYKFPGDDLERLRSLAIREGVGDSNTDVLRWAALQYLKSQQPETVKPSEPEAVVSD